METASKRVLLFLLGSLGDTLVALPALHLVARQFPFAERRMLTDLSLHPKAASMEALLEGSGLVHGYYSFPAPSTTTNRFVPLMSLARDIRRWKPDTVIYLHEQRGLWVALRDAAFFRLLGIRRSIGIPLTRELQRRVYHERSGRFEHRAEYLSRSLASLGDHKLTHRSSWNLNFSPTEQARAQKELASLRLCRGVLAMSIGTKIEVNDWGDDKWRQLLSELSDHLPHWGLVALGASVEHDRTSALLSEWRGPRLNLCGKLSVRESGAVMERARIFMGHDSGPMHLAAAVGTPCVAIFSARHLPGLWFPYGKEHRVFYNQTDCAGCQLSVCAEYHKKCIAGISAREVSAAMLSLLSMPSAAALKNSAV